MRAEHGGRSYGRPMRRLPDLAAPHRLVLTLAVLLAAGLASPAAAAAAWVWPVDGDVITPYRNGTDPYATGQHRGIDIAAPVGTPIVAAAGGDVRFAGTAGTPHSVISRREGTDANPLSVRLGPQRDDGRVNRCCR